MEKLDKEEIKLYEAFKLLTSHISQNKITGEVQADGRFLNAFFALAEEDGTKVNNIMHFFAGLEDNLLNMGRNEL